MRVKTAIKVLAHFAVSLSTMPISPAMLIIAVPMCAMLPKAVATVLRLTVVASALVFKASNPLALAPTAEPIEEASEATRLNSALAKFSTVMVMANSLKLNGIQPPL
jgi:hypothetical protein